MNHIYPGGIPSIIENDKMNLKHRRCFIKNPHKIQKGIQNYSQYLPLQESLNTHL